MWYDREKSRRVSRPAAKKRKGERKMTAEVFLSVVIICGIYVVCQLISKVTRYKVPELVIFMVALIILGGDSSTFCLVIYLKQQDFLR